MSDLTGHTLGQYEIISLIGRGGMSSVYLARQQSINRMVAVKVLPHHLMNDETFLKRFQREVQAVALIQHPRIIPVHDYGEHEGTPYIVMAYIDGGSLAAHIQKTGPLPLDRVERLVSQIGEGLDHAHKLGIIHRDFKPSNVLLDTHGNAYLSDFGIARISQETSHLTGSGIVGTPTYMAPEVFKQEAATPAVDMYALGVTLYQMLSGVAPFEGTTPVALMYAHLNEPVPSIEAARPGVPPAAQIVLDRAMAKDPADRYSSCANLADQLHRALADEEGLEALPPRPAAPKETAAPRPEPAVAGIKPLVEGARSTTPAPAPTPVVSASPGTPTQPLAQPEAKPRRRGCVWGLVIIGVILGGLCLFAQFTGLIARLASQAEAAVTPTIQDIEQTLDGASELEVDLELGVGTTQVERLTGRDLAAEGQFTSASGQTLTTSYELLGETGLLTIAQREFDADSSVFDEDFQFDETLDLRLTDAVPIELVIRAGVGDATLDLDGLDLRLLSVSAGLGSMTIQLPSGGDIDVQINAGVGDITIHIPDSLEVRVEVTSGASDPIIQDDRIAALGTDTWQTDNFGDASNRVRIQITSGVGSIIID